MPRYVKLRKETRLPSAAARGQVRLYAKPDETLETVDDEGNREAVGGGGGAGGTVTAVPIAFNTANLVNPADNGFEIATIPIGAFFEMTVINGANWDSGGDLYLLLAVDAVDPNPNEIASAQIVPTGGAGTQSEGVVLRTIIGSPGTVYGAGLGVASHRKVFAAIYPGGAAPTRGTATVIVRTSTIS